MKRVNRSTVDCLQVHQWRSCIRLRQLSEK